jgi:hypothetical protein
MARVWSSQAYRAAFQCAIVAAQAYRDEERIRFAKQSKGWKNTTVPHRRKTARFERDQAILARTIDALREASEL